MQDDGQLLPHLAQLKPTVPCRLVWQSERERKFASMRSAQKVSGKMFEKWSKMKRCLQSKLTATRCAAGLPACIRCNVPAAAADAESSARQKLVKRWRRRQAAAEAQAEGSIGSGERERERQQLRQRRERQRRACRGSGQLCQSDENKTKSIEKA